MKIKIKPLILTVLISFFIILAVEAVQITKFTNDLSAENITFTGAESKTRYLEIPRYANVTSAYMNFTGYPYENWIESAYVTYPSFETAGAWTYSETDPDFFGQRSTAWKTEGSYSYKLEKPADPGCTAYIPAYAYNQILQSVDFTNIDKMRFDYKLQGLSTYWEARVYVGATLKWSTSTTGTGSDIEIDVSDKSGNHNLIFRLYHNRGEEVCYTTELHFYVDDIEESMIVYPSSPYLEVGTPGGGYEWSHAGTFDSTEKTSDFSSAINTALNSGACDCTGCSLDGDNCTIPFLFHQSVLSIVILEYSAIDINYITAPTVNLVSPDNNTWSSSTKTFNCSAIDETQLSNITFYFWNSTGDLNLSITKNLTGTSNSTTYEMTFNSTDTFYWNCKAINNNSYSDIADNNYTLFVDIDDPIVTLNKPKDEQYVDTQNVQFNYTPEHSTQTVDTCELWANFTGTWALNQTNSTITEDVVNSFNQTLLEGIIYLWSVQCNTTETGNSAFAPSNFTLGIDLTTPSLFLSTPINGTEITTSAGSYDFDLNYTTSDTNLDSCWYNVTYELRGTPAINGTEISDTIIASCENTTFTVTHISLVGYDYNLTLCSNDSANNINCSYTDFVVFYLEEGAGPGGGGGGAGAITPKVGLNWTITNEVGGKVYIFAMSQGDSRIKPVLFQNQDVIDITIDISCENIEGIEKICPFVSFDKTRIIVPPSKTLFTAVVMSVDLPDDIPDGKYSFNVVGTDTSGGTDFISVEVNIGAVNLILLYFNQIRGNYYVDLSFISEKAEEFAIPKFLVLLIANLALFSLLNFVLMRKLDYKTPLSFLTSIIITWLGIVWFV